MADTVQFDLVSPERLLTSVAAKDVRIPGAEGEADYVVTGGFAEINADGISVLAEKAIAREDITQEQFKALVDEATDKLAKAQEVYVNEQGPVDDAAKLLSDMVAMGDHIGLSAN